MKPEYKDNIRYYLENGIDFDNRRIMLDKYIDKTSTGRVIRALQIMENLNKEQAIEIIINSEGGEIETGFALVDTILNSSCPIITIGTGEIASMAFIIFLTGDTRYATKRANFMNHQGWTEVQGNPTEVKRKLALMESLEDVCYDLIDSRTKKSRKWWIEQCKNEDFWFGARDALKYGVIHQIIDNEK